MSSILKKAETYSHFARVYDETFKHVPYFTWADFIHQVFQENKISSNDIVVDLACGTGSIARYLKPIYGNMLSLDLSRAMLLEARQKKINGLLQADLTGLPFAPQSISAACSCHDSLNYLRDYQNLACHFNQLAGAMKRNGIYIFDLSSEKNVIKNYHDQSFTNKFSKTIVHWQNFYDYEKRTITSILEFKDRKKKKYPGVVEIHQQIIFEDNQVIQLAKTAGFKLLYTCADYRRKKKIEKANLTTFVMQRQ